LEDHKVREETVSVILSEILSERGIANQSLLNLGDVPDIYVLFSGIRLVLETKEQGNRAKLLEQLKDRLRKNICDLAIGLEYPRSLVEGSPSTLTVRKRLLKGDLVAICYAHGPMEPRRIFEGSKTSVQSLPELLTRAASEVLPDHDLLIAIHRIRDSIEQFASGIGTEIEAKNIAKKVREVLEFGEQ
jgi:hypothetical protein